MANYFLCFVGQRIVLPVIISSCIYLRPTGFALLYFILLLWLPCVPVATKKTLLGSTGIYFKALVAISALVTSAQLIFQIVLTAMPPYGHTLTNCTFPESVLRQIGLVALNTTQIKDCFRWVLPEVIMLIASILMYIVQKKLTTKNKPAPVTPTDAMSETMSASDIEAAKQKRRFDKKFAYLTSIGKYIALGVLCLAGIMKPSIPNAMYYIVFLGFGTWWACYKKLGRVFGIILRCVALLVALHLTALLLYQLQYLQEMLPQDSPMARYFGLTPIVIVDCDDPRVFKANSEYYTDQLNLVALLCLYYMCIYESKMLLRPAYSINAESALSRHMKNRISHKFPGGKRKSQTSDHWKNATRKIRVYVRAQGRTQPSENTPLMRTVTPERSRHDSVIKEESDQTIIEHIGYGIINIFQIIIKSSYIASNLCMMAWSIMYHSWLAFVFLLWANLVWIIPKQRRTMLLTSPVLVCYAEFLLLVQYIYAMNFTNDELPETIGNFDLNQIGFGRPVKEDVYPLLIKSVFLAMFWVTLRQMMKERDIKRQSSALADMVAPLQITVGTAAADMKQPEIKQSAFMIKMGKFLHSFMTKCWLWVVAISLFVSGLTGDRMTVFRIIYMGLFLIFILTFQISWRAWRKMMYWFWLVVIVYSMLILILVYTYQFEDFKNYWEQYLLIPPDLQLDIGLETYKTRELFFKLITPTIFVIISVIQLHYYHDDFLAITDVTVFNDLPPTEVKTEERSTPGVATTYKRSESLIEAVKSSSIILKLQNWILEKYSDFTDKIWLILELHLLKLTMFAIMLMCIFDVCAMHFFFVCMICLVMPFGNRYQVIVVRVISMFLCILFIMKMIYQIEYIEHSKHLVTCPGWKNTSFNTASWLGFNKASATVPLAEIFMGYIIILIIITVNAGVSFHQSYRRLSLGKVDKRPYVMFPTTTWKSADDDFISFCKYMVNYHFYRLGVEISLITTVILISLRLDFYAVLYSFWLLGIFSLTRKQQARVWNAYIVFVVFVMILQYGIVVGVAPGFCVDYPWHSEDTVSKVQYWIFLPDPVHTPPAVKLLFDYILLAMICRQGLMFRIDSRFKDQDYSGGTNKNILKHQEEPGFVIPIHDFTSSLRNWLDVFFRVFFMAHMWLTLAIVFLAGTLRVNIFSVGYLLGSFYFLWQGTDMFLQPVKNIIRSWNCLLTFNVSMIVLKSALQLVGCLTDTRAEQTHCWAIQLFGIGCMDNYNSKIVYETGQCSVPIEDVGMAWDAACFAFLIFQRRICHSYYFFHVINETKAMTILSSRGAELKYILQNRKIAQQQKDERLLLESIKKKMERIKANQKKIRVPVMGYKNPKNNIEAKRSGDYYMFEEFESIDYDFTSHSEKSRDEVLDEFHDEEAFKNRQKRKMTVSEEHVRVVHPRETQYDELSDELQDASDGDTHQEEEKQRGIVYRILHNILRYLMFGWAFVESLMVSMTLYLNKYSKDYRYVRKVMAKDKIRIKSNPDFGIGTRSGRALVWAPKVISKTAVDPNINKDNDEEDKLRGSGTTSPEEMYRKAVEEENRIERLNEATAIELQGITSDENQEEIELKERKSKDATYKGGAKRRPRKASMLNVPEIRILAPSLERGLDSEEPYPKESRHSSHTSLDDYDETTMDKDDQSPFVQLVLAMWFIVLSHSDIVCYFMIFLHQIKSATLLSLPLPLIVFGWGTLSVPRPSKTFWITIIAYTQVIVLIKCMFQFEFLPWNQNDFPDQSPFHPATFIGINKVQQYATYDLCLLLVVFFHRTMLMSLGLWKTTVAEDAEEIDNYNMGMSKNELTNAEKLQSSSSSSSSSDSIDSVLLEDDGGGGDNGAGGDVGGGGDENTDGSSKKPRQRLVSASGLTVELDGSEKNFEERGSGDSNIVATRKERAGPCVQFPTVMIMSVKKYAESTRMFFVMLFNGKIKVSTNVYSIMFICDFFNFFVICFAFSSFSAGNTTILDYLSENKVPLTFLVMVIVQFFLMIIDRAIFLRKAIVCKLIFQYILIIGVHIWMFFVLPSITERAFNNRIAPQMWYVVKCIYLMVSAYQIRSGYPTKILGNFICQRYTLTRKLAFKGYMFIPFLYELRTVMDWIWTGTSMSLFDWLNMEDIFCTIFDLKCSRNFEEKSNSPRGTKKSPIVKAFLGGTFLFGIIGVLWFPLIFFAIGDSVGNPNLPTEIRVQLRLGASEPIFDITALGNDIKPFGQNELTEFTSAYRKHKSALYFLSDFVYQDIAAVILNSDSVHNWAISPPDRARLLDVLESKLKNETLKVTMIQTLMHKSNNKEHPDVITSKLDQNLDDNLKPELARMIKENVNSSIVVRNIFPKFVRVYNKGEITPVHQLMIKEIEDKSVNRNINLKLEKRNGLEWWNVQENCSDNLHTTILSNLPFVDCTKLVMYTFNDKIFDARLNWISGAGIIGAYVTIVFVIWRMGKDIFAGGVHKIPFEELPCVDRILQLCLDIYLVRESGDYYLEEELYAKLIFLFRSPETLIKWSRPIEEEEEEDDEEATVAAM